MNMYMQELRAFNTSSAINETRDSIKDLVELQKQQIQLLNGMLAEEKNNLRKLREKDDEYDEYFSSRHTSSYTETEKDDDYYNYDLDSDEAYAYALKLLRESIYDDE